MAGALPRRDNREHAAHFATKAEAQRWIDRQTASLVRGDWVDPRSGNTTVAAYAAGWATAQLWRPSTRDTMMSRLCNHVLPEFGERPMGKVLPTQVQA